MDIRKLRAFSLITLVVMWFSALITFWCVMEPTDAMGYAILFFYLIFPAVAFVVSAVNSYYRGLDIRLLVFPFILGLSTMLIQYFTFIFANAISCDKSPLIAFVDLFVDSDIGEMILLTIPSFVGLILGFVVRKIKGKS